MLEFVLHRISDVRKGSNKFVGRPGISSSHAVPLPPPDKNDIFSHCRCTSSSYPRTHFPFIFFVCLIESIEARHKIKHTPCNIIHVFLWQTGAERNPENTNKWKDWNRSIEKEPKIRTRINSGKMRVHWIIVNR